MTGSAKLKLTMFASNAVLRPGADGHVGSVGGRPTFPASRSAPCRSPPRLARSPRPRWSAVRRLHRPGRRRSGRAGAAAQPAGLDPAPPRPHRHGHQHPSEPGSVTPAYSRQSSPLKAEPQPARPLTAASPPASERAGAEVRMLAFLVLTAVTVVVQLTVVNRLPLPGGAAPDLVLLLVTAIAAAPARWRARWPASRAASRSTWRRLPSTTPGSTRSSSAWPEWGCRPVDRAITDVRGERDRGHARRHGGRGGRRRGGRRARHDAVRPGRHGRGGRPPAAHRVLYDVLVAPFAFWLVARVTRGADAERAPAPEFSVEQRVALVFRSASAGAAAGLRLATAPGRLLPAADGGPGPAAAAVKRPRRIKHPGGGAPARRSPPRRTGAQARFGGTARQNRAGPHGAARAAGPWQGLAARRDGGRARWISRPQGPGGGRRRGRTAASAGPRRSAGRRRSRRAPRLPGKGSAGGGLRGGAFRGVCRGYPAGWSHRGRPGSAAATRAARWAALGPAPRRRRPRGPGPPRSAADALAARRPAVAATALGRGRSLAGERSAAAGCAYRGLGAAAPSGEWLRRGRHREASRWR